jgi:tRNA-Thr(GGU) m(6)t(6)A37 methyltransferase TsaA
MTEMDRIEAVIVGHVRSPLSNRTSAPRQGRDTAQEAVIEVLQAYGEALEGIGGWDQLLVTCWLHLAPRDVMAVHPKRDKTQPLSGVFGTRSPARPNPIAVYTVDLLKVDGRRLHVRGIDAVDGTPVLDCKPHIHRLDD